MMTTARRGPTNKPPTVPLGDLTITLLDGGTLWLDGGAMFGLIPKPLWSKLVEVDEANRIPLATTCFLIQSAGKRVLVETGIGAAQKYGEKERGFFRLGSHWLLDSLQAAGIERESIDFVIITHLHFDHAGGGTMPDGKGGHELTFPSARYVVQSGEWEDAINGHTVMANTYRAENLAPLEASGALSLVQGEAEIVPGVFVKPMPGHTRHHQGVVFAGGDAGAVSPGDLMPTGAHAGLRYNMAYDLLPYENMQAKQQLLSEAADGKWRLLLGQDPLRANWHVTRDGQGRFTVIPDD